MTKSEIMDLIDEEGVEFIRLQFADIFGRLKNIAVTPGQMNDVFRNRYNFNGMAAFGGRYDYDEKIYLHPKLNTFMILPWRPQTGKVAKIMCELCYEDGTIFDLSTRNILKNTLKKAEEKGYSFMADPECEFFLFHTDENGLPTTTTHELAGYLDVGPTDFGENARREIVLLLEDLGFEIESSHHEQAPAQHEVHFKEEDALHMADSILTFRFAVRSIAKRFGLYATFLPKPKAGVAGSGMHTHITMMKDGRNAFRNADGSASQEAYYFLGGLLKHADALCAFANPIVNSYKRLLDGFLAPSKAVWSSRGEKAMVKLNCMSDDVKIELRYPDNSCNPYLLLATTIAAGMDGIENKIDPGINISEDKAAYDRGRDLPENLKEAINAFVDDQVLVDCLGKEFSDIYAKIKYAEWRDYMKDISSWEIDRYLTKM